MEALGIDDIAKAYAERMQLDVVAVRPFVREILTVIRGIVKGLKPGQRFNVEGLGVFEVRKSGLAWEITTDAKGRITKRHRGERSKNKLHFTIVRTLRQNLN